MPIGIFRMLKVPQRPAAPDLGNGGKVICWRGRRSGPFKRPCVPRIAPGKPAPPVRPKQVADEHQHARRLKEYAYGHDEIPDVPASSRLVSIDSAGHPENAGNMHEIEGQMESDDEKPEMKFAECL